MRNRLNIRYHIAGGSDFFLVAIEFPGQVPSLSGIRSADDHDLATPFGT